MSHFMKRLTCLIVGHRAPAFVTADPPTQTMVISYAATDRPIPGIPTGKRIVFHFEPCFRCGELFLYEYSELESTASLPKLGESIGKLNEGV